MKNSMILLSLLIIGCAQTYTFVEYEHISSVTQGKPFNDNRETSADVLYAGYRFKSNNGLYVDLGLGVETVTDDLEGEDPYAKIKIGKEWRKK